MSRLLLVALSVSLFAACGGGAKNPLALLPEDTEYVLVFDFAALRKSELWKSASDETAERLDDEEVKELVARPLDAWDELVEDLGLDPLEDVDRIVAGMGMPMPGDVPVLVVIEGKGFDVEDLVDVFEDRSGEELDEDEHEGVDMYLLGEEVALAFPDEKTILAGQPAWVEIGIELHAGKGEAKSAKDNEDLAAVLARAEKGAQMILAGEVNAVIRMAAKNAPVEGLGDVRAVTWSLVAGDGLVATATLEMKDDDAAEELLDSLEDLLDRGKEMFEAASGAIEDKKTRKDLKKIVDRIELSAEKELLVATLDMGSVGGADLVGYVAAVMIPAFGKYIGKAKGSEAHSMVGRIASSAAAYYETEHASRTGEVLPRMFPETTDWTPPRGSCCKKDKGTCTPDAGDWEAATWRALMFDMLDPYRYSYRFESEGTGKDATFRALASGDLDCDGAFSTFEVRGTVGSGDLVDITPMYVEDEME